jgi:hypothetical protein
MASENDSVEEVEEEVVPEYFFTESYPHRWSGSPALIPFDPETFRPIASLEEAKALAEKHRVGGYSETRCDTTYGVQYIPKSRKHN